MNFTIVENEITCYEYPEFKKVYASHSEALHEIIYNSDQLENEILKGDN